MTQEGALAEIGIQFEWNEHKAAENERKHGVSFLEASTVFDDPLAITQPDREHSYGEARYLTFGRSSEERFLVVSHIEIYEAIRIISARLMQRSERKAYENDYA